MSSEKIKFLKDNLVDAYNLYECVMSYLVEDKGISMIEALDIVYNSQTYEKINDLATGLYYQSSGYNYDMLKHELKYGKVG